ncbi:VOC family protein [Robiginitalea sp. IMCC43444]|uniref:VOC family protein n=1 Tax=Robiginitalea sp. IMCC43444 TaxID=3459121 RepID=UPI0040430865
MNLNQITLPTLDVQKSISFYTLLGLKLIVRALPDYARFECPEGDATLSLHRVEEMAEREGPVIYFECTDLDERVKSLQRQGVLFDSPPVDKPWLWREARLRDPDGNPLVLFYAGKNRKDPPWKLSG